MRTAGAVFLNALWEQELLAPFSFKENGLYGRLTALGIRKTALTTPPQDEVELVTNSARQLLPESNMSMTRARSATLDTFFLSRFLRRLPMAPAGRARELAGRLLNAPPVFAAHTSSALGRFALAS
jgi:hypothetical protein